MNILYLSNLTGNLFAGPNNSVPAQIRAQSKIDNVFWYNINNMKRDEWKALNCFNLKDYPTGRLKDLPTPFNKPDIIVIEEFYCFPFCKLIKEAVKNKIPYIIIPRSELTKNAQRKKYIKKFLGNVVYFKKMAQKATAIQFLSLQEKLDTGEKWNKKYMIIPNGIEISNNKKDGFSKNEIKATYIGRYELYQKGLDILIDAIANTQDILRQNNFILNMYGVDQEGTIKIIGKKIIEYGISDLVKINSAVFGEEKKKIILESDVFVLTSRFEGMPMGLIEALSYGIPCLVTKGTNMSEDINSYNAGWTSDNTIENLKDAIKKMLKDKEKFEIIGDNAKKLSLKYSWKQIAEKTHNEFEKIILEKLK